MEKLAYDVFLKTFGQEANLANVIAGFIWYFAGASIIFIFDVSHRDKSSLRTPVKFSALFMIEDNISRVLLTINIGFAVVAGGSALLNIFGFIIPEQVGRFLPFICGLSSDYISLLIKNKFFKQNDAPKQ